MSLASLTVKIGADLSDLNKGLTEANQGVQRLGRNVSGNLTAPIRTSTSAMVANAGAVTQSATAWKALREPLTSATRSLLQLNPAATQVSSVLGTMAIGAGPMVGILAGVAALSLGWNLLTRDAKENEKATKDAIATLTQLQEKQRLGSSGGTGAREAEKTGVELFFVQEEIARLQGDIATAIREKRARGSGFEKLQADLNTQLAEEVRLRGLIKAHDIEIGEVRAKKAAEAAAQHKRELADLNELKKAQREYLDMLAERSMERLGPMPGPSMGTVRPPLLTNNAGGMFATSAVATSILALQARAAQQLSQSAAELKAAAAAQKAAALQQYAGAQATALLSQHGGAIGGILAGAISGGMTAGPWGAAIGAGSALIGTILSQRKSTDANTAAIQRLTQAIYGEPTGFKANNYRYQATDPSGAMRWLNGAADVFASRGGQVTYG